LSFFPIILLPVAPLLPFLVTSATFLSGERYSPISQTSPAPPSLQASIADVEDFLRHSLTDLFPKDGACAIGGGRRLSSTVVSSPDLDVLPSFLVSPPRVPRSFPRDDVAPGPHRPSPPLCYVFLAFFIQEPFFRGERRPSHGGPPCLACMPLLLTFSPFSRLPPPDMFFVETLYRRWLP